MKHAKRAALAGGWLLFALAPCFPAVPPTMPGGSHATQQAPQPEARVDINHASLEELMKVPGMTRTWATRIVRFRPYRTKLDLVDHGIVTPVVYGRIKDYVIAHRDKQ